MLVKNPVNRLYQLESIKQHAYFKNYSWDKLGLMSLDPPYMPVLKKQQQGGSGIIPYLEYVKGLKDYVPEKKKVIDSAKKKEYEKWHANF